MKISNSLCELFLEKEKRSSENRKRNYLHFDRKISFVKVKGILFEKLRYGQNIVSRSFYPFISVKIKTPRYKYNSDLNKRVLTTKDRNIFFAAHFDSLIYSLYSTILTYHYERYISKKDFSNSIIAYRSLKKCNIDFAKEVFDFVKHKGNCVVLAFDISKFFDNLDHKILLGKWLKIIKKNELPLDHKKIYNNITKFSHVDQEELFKLFDINFKKNSKRKYRICEPKDFRTKVRNGKLIKTNSTNKGIPQGSPISAILSNIYMISFDSTIYKLVMKFNGLYRRYSDDIIIVCDEDNYRNIKDAVLDEIKNKCDLEINSEKTDITFFEKKADSLKSYNETKSKNKLLQYLGFEFNGNSMYIRSSSMSRYYRRLKNAVSTTIKRAYGNKAKGDKIFRKALYNRYTVKGKQNFISYARRSIKLMDSVSIRKQISRHFDIIKNEIEKKALKREEELKKINKFKKSML